MNEGDIMRLCRVAARECGATMHRNNVGKAWVGTVRRVLGGDTLLQNARWFHAGLCKGSSDLIGWMTVEITPDMVGKKFALFTAIEVKTHRGRIKAEQQNFIDQVRKAGGLAGVVRNTRDVEELLNAKP